MGKAKVEVHELISQLIDLAQQLERTPTKKEFCEHFALARHGISFHYSDRYEPLLLAAGLDLNVGRKITKEIFNKSIEKHLQNYEPRKIIDNGPYPTLAVISDIHWPFESKEVLKKFHEYVGDVKPEYVCINGDAVDFYSFSRFPRSHNIFTPKDEVSMARKSNEDFWKLVQKNSPKSKCVQTLGNHDVRPIKQIISSFPQAEDWIAEKLKELFTFQGVETVFDSRQEYYLRNDIIIHHGYRSKLGDHRDHALMNSINGHTHKGGVAFRQIRGQVLWELNSGLAGNPEAKGLTYNPQKISDWTLGFGILNKYGPQFIHL